MVLDDRIKSIIRAEPDASAKRTRMLDEQLTPIVAPNGTQVILAHMGSYQPVRLIRTTAGHCRVRGAVGMEMGDDLVVETADGQFVQGVVVWSLEGETCIQLASDLGIKVAE
jgi:hypothetical protein